MRQVPPRATGSNHSHPELGARAAPRRRMNARLLMLLLALALGVFAVMAGACSTTSCNCPNDAIGTGWCDGGVTDGECACKVSVVCPGFCLDAGNPTPCDGG